MIRLCIAMFVALSSPLAAQWVHYPTPGIPRTPDGKPNLAAPGAPGCRWEAGFLRVLGETGG
jgi:hypothetical protein